MKKVFAIQIICLIGFLVMWQVVVTAIGTPEYILPSPLQIGGQIITNYPLLLKHAYVTLLEAVGGFALGAGLAFLFALGMSYSKMFETLIYPFLIFTQTTPRIALAPLLLIWFGYGLLPKIVISAIVCFFPIVVGTAKGIKSVDSELLDLMNSYGSTKTETLVKVKLPAALPYIFAALKVSITLSVIGAVVGEFVGSDAGLGYLILHANANLNTSLMFAEIILLSLMGMSLFGIIGLVEKKVLSWHMSEVNVESI